MDNNHLEKFFTKMKDVSLGKEKKESIRQEIVRYMKKNPLPEKAAQKNWLVLVMQTIRQTDSLARLKSGTLAFAALLLVFLGGGLMGIQADAALPGDFLYPFKVGVNEKIFQVLAFSDEEKIEVATELTERRLQEMEKLIVQHKITSSNEATFNTTFKKQSDIVSEKIETLKKNKKHDQAAQAYFNFTSLLNAHDVVLKNLKNENPNTVSDTLLKEIDQKKEAISQTNKKITDDILVNIEIEKDTAKREKTIHRRLKSAEDDILSVQKIMKNKKNTIGQKMLTQIENNLAEAKEKIDEGKVSIESQLYGEAFSSFQDAQSLARETEHLLKAKNDLRIDIDMEILKRDSKNYQKKNNE